VDADLTRFPPTKRGANKRTVNLMTREKEIEGNQRHVFIDKQGLLMHAIARAADLYATSYRYPGNYRT
jgi:hypothetical protein